ncbi:MAG: hypothetical protein AMS22_11920 [Thiotrichales bacterium SG8_50]|nr:MAG: hypothetical protein AMS22_11920 [Thiotrichales bacterium SG8_50]
MGIFTAIKTMFGGAVSPKTIIKFVRGGASGLIETLDDEGIRNFIAVLAMPYPPFISEWQQYPKLLSNWEEEFIEKLERALTDGDVTQQKIALRKLLLEANETRIFGETVFLNYNVEQQKILHKILDKEDQEFDDYYGYLRLSMLAGELEVVLLRQVLRWYYNDYREYDFFDTHTDVFTTICEQKFEIVLKNIDDEMDSVDELILAMHQPLQDSIEQLKQTAYTGADIVYPPSDDKAETN